MRAGRRGIRGLQMTGTVAKNTQDSVTEISLRLWSTLRLCVSKQTALKSLVCANSRAMPASIIVPSIGISPTSCHCWRGSQRKAGDAWSDASNTNRGERQRTTGARRGDFRLLSVCARQCEFVRLDGRAAHQQKCHFSRSGDSNGRNHDDVPSPFCRLRDGRSLRAFVQRCSFWALQGITTQILHGRLHVSREKARVFVAQTSQMLFKADFAVFTVSARREIRPARSACRPIARGSEPRRARKSRWSREHRHQCRKSCRASAAKRDHSAREQINRQDPANLPCTTA